jgi:hypothetical protein
MKGPSGEVVKWSWIEVKMMFLGEKEREGGSCSRSSSEKV